MFEQAGVPWARGQSDNASHCAIRALTRVAAALPRAPREGPGRRRFTLADELGHRVCQCLEGRAAPVMCRAEDVAPIADRALEREANVFAAELLVPE
jgi:hypothetical protein